MIKVIVLGKLKEKYLSDLVDDYLKRISKYHKIELIEIKDEENLESEAKNIMKFIAKQDYVVTLEILGNSYTSEEFAKFINQTFIYNGTITFVIGSSTGLHESIKNRSNMAISFGKFTFPHGLFRGILLEQIYRAFKINNNESYHK